ncbi:ATP-binding cassette domain-containing protein [Spartinivicinus ruber]|uniref:ATP-binding cassette domain-containing protein n=1 Tax=Spartinivicinus ruber TaxID=2683272 RepID=UPI0013D36384|nr:ATP-binding cassette domain-containing protein [Spartinivicinus ruber]
MEHIHLTDVQYSWQPNQLTIDIPELIIERYSRVFIKGPSGCGKTTLLGLLGGIMLPNQGSINLLGTDVAKLSSIQRDHFRSEHIGFIFQMFNLLPYLSVVDNIILPCRFSKKRKQKALAEYSSLPEAAMSLLTQLGLNQPDLHKRKVTELSIGQQQRVAAARALIGHPELIIADEPTSALDTDAREGFLKLLFEVCKKAGATLLFVSHDGTLEHLFSNTLDMRLINKASQTVSSEGA